MYVLWAVEKGTTRLSIVGRENIFTNDFHELTSIMVIFAAQNKIRRKDQTERSKAEKVEDEQTERTYYIRLISPVVAMGVSP